MAVLIASDLAKDMAGVPLLRGVSFRLERRDRLTLSGRNGSGKTTLLRMLAGETTVDGGERNLAKDVRVALHDQRPPRERDISLLALTAPFALAAEGHDGGEGIYGETDDKVITNAGFFLIAFFPLFILKASLIQGGLEKRKDRRKAAEKARRARADQRGGWSPGRSSTSAAGPRR